MLLAKQLGGAPGHKSPSRHRVMGCLRRSLVFEPGSILREADHFLLSFQRAAPVITVSSQPFRRSGPGEAPRPTMLGQPLVVRLLMSAIPPTGTL